MIRRPAVRAVVAGALLVALAATGATAQVDLPDPAAAPLAVRQVIEGGVSRAGVATADASWHMGASGGQFSETAAPISPDYIDPHGHATRKAPTQEIGSRILTRALVVEGAEGNRVAVVANDLYLPNDLLNRRVGQLVEQHDALVAAGLADGPATGLDDTSIAVTVSHNHNSAFYSTPSWGTWIFQDVVDIRFFDYMAEQMAQAVIDAAAELRPVRMGAVTVPFNEIGSHTIGPKVGLDGTPAGQPWSHTTGQLSVVRFDDITDPADPEPYAAWVTLGIHPEWTWGYDVFNGDITHAAMRVIDRELGVTTVMSQRETGSSGPHKDERVHDGHERREFQDNGFANLDVGARLWADAVAEAFDHIAAVTPTVPYDPEDPRTDGPPISLVPFTEGFTIDVASARFAPPTMRPAPGISNCNTAQLFHGNPQAPILGFPDCENFGLDEPGGQVIDATPVEEAALFEQLQDAGIPLPDSYSATALTAVEETAAVHIMAMRFGDLAVTFCPCEQFTDTALNVQTRLDRIEGNLWRGWDWTSQTTPAGRDWCVPGPAEDLSTCADPRNPSVDLPPVATADVERMLAQINNDAAGWETDVGSAFGESEAQDPADILGNFTHVEHTAHGYGMAISIGMANDYFGYVPEYREMRAHEHYRKALNGLGLHGADYLATRMVGLAVELNGGPPVEMTALDLAYQAESARALAVSTTMGEAANAYEEVYAAALPADGGTPAITAQPTDITRFDAAVLSWVGGSNYSDMPQVTVQRQQPDGTWQTVGTMEGEVQARLEFPSPADLPAVEAGTFEWVWHAQHEAFASDVALPEVGGTRVDATPEGTYRFTVAGHHRAGPGDDVQPYALASEPFAVTAWEGITADLADTGAQLVVRVGPGSPGFGPIDYPNTYDTPLQYVQGDQRRTFTYPDGDVEHYCPFCRFREWVDVGDADRVTVAVRRGNGAVREVAAQPLGDGRWAAPVVLGPRDTAWVAAGGVIDRWGNRNGQPSAVVGSGPR